MGNEMSNITKMLATATPEARARFQDMADIVNEKYEAKKKSALAKFRKYNGDPLKRTTTEGKG